MVKKMCNALGMLNVLASRAFTTSNIRALSPNTPLEDSFYYQVLIDSDDWNEMHFPYNLTTCLNSIGNMEQKNKTEYNGMDIVAHDEIRPYQNLQDLSDESPPIKNEHIYQCFPMATLGEEGINARDGQNFHLWRCLFRIRNFGKKMVTLKDIKLDTTTSDGSYTSLEESLTENLTKKLTSSKSVTQFALHFEMPLKCEKGNSLCGYFIAEDDQKRKIKLIIPLTPLESNPVYSQEQMETVSLF
uniref:ApaG domain-containing protein n=1 Tax=Meloidogyne hapla TaxID=6305 RepID=A0A1I8B1A6_MELHA